METKSYLVRHTLDLKTGEVTRQVLCETEKPDDSALVKLLGDRFLAHMQSKKEGLK